MRRYWRLFSNVESIWEEFRIELSDSQLQREVDAPVDPNVPADRDVLFAYYSYEDYSGTAFVLYKKGRKLFEAHGSHCSCDGLEGQWHPEETTWEALDMRDYTWSYDGEAEAALRSLVQSKLRRRRKVSR